MKNFSTVKSCYKDFSIVLVFILMLLAGFFLCPHIVKAQEVVPEISNLPPATATPDSTEPSPGAPGTSEGGPAVTSPPQPAPQGSPAPPPNNRGGIGDPGIGTEQAGSKTTTTGTVSALYPAVQFLQIILLFVMGGMLGFYYYKNYLLNLRVHRLEVLIEKSGISPVSQDEPVPFSWDQALKSLEGGWGLFTPETRIYSPGVVCIKSEDEDLGFKSSANLIKRMINQQNMAVVYLSKTRGEEDLGRILLNLESGIPVASLSKSEREELVGRYTLEMSKYESGLFIFQDFNIEIDELYDNILKLADKYEIGLIIIDGGEVISSKDFDDLITKLRLISIKTYIPIVFTDTFKDMEPEKISPDTMDRITALINLSKNEDNKLSFKVHKFQGDPPPETMNFDPETGEITVIS